MLLVDPILLSKQRGLCLSDSGEIKKKKGVGRGGKKTDSFYSGQCDLLGVDRSMSAGWEGGRAAIMRDQLRDISLATELFSAEAK